MPAPPPASLPHLPRGSLRGSVVMSPVVSAMSLAVPAYDGVRPIGSRNLASVVEEDVLVHYFCKPIDFFLSHFADLPLL